MTVELVQAIGQYIVMPLSFVAAIYIVVKWF